ncbi:MAG: type II toxin-antitoxin system HicA family toxin [Selenomonas sp.]|nr:type II toxin-antitoxin system HicA family toxin [Selenomonas sp.]
MNSKQRQAVAAVFRQPTCKNLVFQDLENLLIAIGCEVIEGDGSRVGFKKNGLRLDMHRPHPGKEAKAYQVRAIKDFLKMLGVTP